MVYDLLIKNGRIVDGSGMPAFHGDVAVSGGKIVELGRLDGPAARVIDAEGNVIAPGFIDNHCHYDAQVTWDPLCTYSCYHGATSVIIGNCSLTLAPVRPNDHETLAGMLSEVEAIPMDICAKLCRGTGRLLPSTWMPSAAVCRSTWAPWLVTRRCGSLPWGRRVRSARRQRASSRSCDNSCVRRWRPALLVCRFRAT